MTRSLLASLLVKCLATKHATVKWTIGDRVALWLVPRTQGSRVQVRDLARSKLS